MKSFALSPCLQPLLRRDHLPPLLSPMKNLIFACLGALLLTATTFVLAQQGNARMIAVAANGNTISASVGSQPGRSPFFLFFDKQGTFVEAVNNPYKDAGNAGIPTLDFLASKGIKVLVAESYGPKIVEVMKEKGIRPVEFKGSAKDAVKKALELR
jgi:predicted Fe-Mo cluster-binding NifX family protein